ncbi:hypothetical protein INR49_011175 [Caranx melampygus]|nr:hypothetical protein INR49_011175 [Caranx melampygus]
MTGGRIPMDGRGGPLVRCGNHMRGLSIWRHPSWDIAWHPLWRTTILACNNMHLVPHAGLRSHHATYRAHRWGSRGGLALAGDSALVPGQLGPSTPDNPDKQLTAAKGTTRADGNEDGVGPRSPKAKSSGESLGKPAKH